MVYIGADGNLTEDKPKYAFLEGIIRGVFGFFALLIGSITGNPNTIRVRALMAMCDVDVDVDYVVFLFNIGIVSDTFLLLMISLFHFIVIFV
jgi:hypothetical protein